jgi:hypothetical protein
MDVMFSPLSGRAVEIIPAGGKHPLPTQFLHGVRIFSRERAGEADGTETSANVRHVLTRNLLNVAPQWSGDTFRQFQ